MRSIVVVVASAALCMALAGASSASLQLGPEYKICGQIKNGPYGTGTFPLDGKMLKGKTWTVFAGPKVTCGFALKVSPGILKRWAKAKPVTDFSAPKGFTCVKVRKDPRTLPNVQCNNISGAKILSLEIWMMGKYTVAQLRAFRVFGH